MELNLYCENEFDSWKPNEEEIIEGTKKIFNSYMEEPEIADHCAITGRDFKTVAFDILFCDSQKTHVINKEYRNKDYPADIITFAVFADSPEEEKFILDFEINLGEIIIALDKIIEESQKKEIPKEEELYFLISHGILHLLGFDHQTEEEFNFVVKHQKMALKKIGIVYDKI